MSRKDDLLAELALLEAEEEFVEKKLDGTLTVEDRHALRALRESYRLNRQARVTVNPETVTTIGNAEVVSGVKVGN